MSVIRSLVFAGLTGLVAACSGGNESIQNQAGFANEIRTALVNQRAAKKAPEIVVTRALLDQLTVPSLEVVAESRERTAYLVPFSNRGDVSTWRTTDGGQVILRSGLIIATRGVGDDLASSDSDQTLAALARRSGATTRRLFVRNGNSGQDQVTLSCQTTDLGRITIEIVEKNFDTQHVRETCQVGQGTVTNDYWIEPASGLIRQSRQWLGPEIGYLRVRVLKQSAN